MLFEQEEAEKFERRGRGGGVYGDRQCRFWAVEFAGSSGCGVGTVAGGDTGPTPRILPAAGIKLSKNLLRDATVGRLRIYRRATERAKGLDECWGKAQFDG